MTFAVVALPLIAYGNLVNAVFRPPLPGGSWVHVAFGLALVVTTLIVARRAGLTRADLGLERIPFGLAAGAAVAAIVVLPALVLMRAPPLLGEPLRYDPIRRVDDATLALHLLVFLPLGAVIPEELAFRGALLGWLRRVGPGGRGPRVGQGPHTRAVLLSAVAFALWHASVIGRSVAETNLSGPLFATLGVLGAAVVLVTGGVALAVLRLRSRSLAAPLAAHWLFNAAVLLGLRA